jgi:AraC-like DNA-binding protein
LAFAIYQRPVSRDASSIAQTDVQHFADEEVMRNSRASLAEVATSTGFADQHHLARVFRRTTGITSSTYRRSLQQSARRNEKDTTCSGS